MGGFGGLPPGFFPFSFSLALRRAILASYSAYSLSKQTLARASIVALASAITARRASRRAIFSGKLMPSGMADWSAYSAMASNDLTSPLMLNLQLFDFRYDPVTKRCVERHWP